ncbi:MULTISPECIES: helix-turn-helix domain-containing protein [unclassified Blastococcus]
MDEGDRAELLAGMLRRARRVADLSQREMAAAAGVAKSTLAAAEAGARDLPVGALLGVLAVARLRLALIGADGAEVLPMSDRAIRDHGGRRFPAHLDPRHSDEGWWHGSERYSRPQPWYTFDLSRSARDGERRLRGVPDDHQPPRAGDSPAERRAARRAEAAQRRREDLERRRLAGELPTLTDFACTCPPACAEGDDGLRPFHVDDCPCRCDVD